MVDAVRSDVARQVDGLIWKSDGGEPDDGDGGAAGGRSYWPTDTEAYARKPYRYP